MSAWITASANRIRSLLHTVSATCAVSNRAHSGRCGEDPIVARASAILALSILGIGYTHTFSERLLNDLHGGYFRYAVNALPFNFGKDLGTQLGIPNVNRPGYPNSTGLTNIDVAGFTSLGDSQYLAGACLRKHFPGRGYADLDQGQAFAEVWRRFSPSAAEFLPAFQSARVLRFRRRIYQRPDHRQRGQRSGRPSVRRPDLQ